MELQQSLKISKGKKQCFTGIKGVKKNSVGIEIAYSRSACITISKLDTFMINNLTYL